MPYAPIVRQLPAAKPPRPYKPTPYARLVQRVWGAMSKCGFVFYLEPGRIAGHCPVCRTGSLGIEFIRSDPPRVRQDGCTAGCSPELINQALA